jgi:hypothetical protein
VNTTYTAAGKAIASTAMIPRRRDEKQGRKRPEGANQRRCQDDDRGRDEHGRPQPRFRLRAALEPARDQNDAEESDQPQDQPGEERRRHVLRQHRGDLREASGQPVGERAKAEENEARDSVLMGREAASAGPIHRAPPAASFLDDAELQHRVARVAIKALDLLGPHFAPRDARRAESRAFQVVLEGWPMHGFEQAFL